MRCILREIVCCFLLCSLLSFNTYPVNQVSVHIAVILKCDSVSEIQFLNFLPDKCREGTRVIVTIYVPEHCSYGVEVGTSYLIPCLTKVERTQQPRLSAHVFLKHILDHRTAVGDVNIFLSSRWHDFTIQRFETLLRYTPPSNISLAGAESSSALQSDSFIISNAFVRLAIFQQWAITPDDFEQQEECSDNNITLSSCSLDFEELCSFLEKSYGAEAAKRCLLYAANPAHDFAASKSAIDSMLANHGEKLLKTWNRSGGNEMFASLPFPWSQGLMLSRSWEPLLDHHIQSPFKEGNDQYGVPSLDLEHLFRKHFGHLVTPGTSAKLHQFDFRSPGRSFKIYIYDLPPQMHHDMVIGLTQYLIENGVGCGYNIGACTASGHLSEYSMVLDHGAEVVIMMKFLMGAERGAFTADPEEADIFLVPFLGACAICTYSRSNYQHLYNTTLPGQLLSFLPHFNSPSKRRRHVFLKTCESVLNFDAHGEHQILTPAWSDFYGADPEFFMIDLGFRRRGNMRHIVVPPPILHRDVQLPPSDNVLSMSRDILLFLFAGLRSPGLASSTERNRFVRMVQTLKANQGQLPPPLNYARIEVHLVGHSDLSLAESGALMRRSVFCPCPPGDTPVTVRFFQAVLEGCIPVVLEYDSIVPGSKSWHCAFSAPFNESLPFASRIDYARFVLAVPATDIFNATYFASHLLMAEEEVLARQEYLGEIRSLLMYDLSGQRPDAFSMILEEISDSLSTSLQDHSSDTP